MPRVREATVPVFQIHAHSDKCVTHIERVNRPTGRSGSLATGFITTEALIPFVAPGKYTTPRSGVSQNPVDVRLALFGASLCFYRLA